MKGNIERKNPGDFRPGKDERRNVRGQVSGEAVALSALLKQYLADEGRKIAGKEKRTRAEALAVKIWDRALLGDYQFVNFLAERILGKVKDSVAIENLPAEQPKLTIEVVHLDSEGNELSREESRNGSVQ